MQCRKLIKYFNLKPTQYLPGSKALASSEVSMLKHKQEFPPGNLYNMIVFEQLVYGTWGFCLSHTGAWEVTHASADSACATEAGE
jgi:hypothetical protein